MVSNPFYNSTPTEIITRTLKSRQVKYNSDGLKNPKLTFLFYRIKHCYLEEYIVTKKIKYTEKHEYKSKPTTEWHDDVYYIFFQ